MHTCMMKSEFESMGFHGKPRVMDNINDIEADHFLCKCNHDC